MKYSLAWRPAVAGVALLFSATSFTVNGPATLERGIAPGTSRDVIVILRDQLPSQPPMRGAHAARAAAIAAAQTPVLADLRQSGAAKVRQFTMINALAATVSQAEAEHLASHPLVQAVVPDAIIKMKSASHTSAMKNALTGRASSTAGLCNTLEPQALQLMNVAFLNTATPQAQRVRDGNGRFVTGQGVRVAYLADGLDPTVQGFVRPDGSSAFIDYQDFSGDPAGIPTPGGEAFGDASSIAAQDTPNGSTLLFDISQFVNAAHPLPAPCNIRIRGVAPGASLVGLKVFGELGFTTTSSFVQAIEWAVTHDNVDVINESFGGNPFPDTANDPISLADKAAVDAGVTVVSSTGDAGTNGTLGTPSTNPWVISAGATTQYRLYAQTGFGTAPLSGPGFLNNNIASFSSGGFSQTGAFVPDIVAPGDLGWALCSVNTPLFTDCVSNASTATPIQAFGGTSESSPLTAGTAALVIQAYRSTHQGNSPSPALVKQIIMSSATDLGAPPSEQGAGLINALRAVQIALSIEDANGKGKPTAGGLLFGTTSAAVTDLPGTPEELSVAVTNTGTTAQQLVPAVQKLGAPIAAATIPLALNPATDPFFLNSGGSPRHYISQTFTVPAGADHLDAAIAWQAPFTSASPPIAYLGLVDPNGNNVQYSEPQGFGSGYGHVDAVKPTPGVWTAYIWTRGVGISGSYTGPVQFSWAAEKYVSAGSVSPSALTVGPGATRFLTVRYSMAQQPGDSGIAVRFSNQGSASATFPEIPISLRTLIAIGRQGGFFNGTLTGGNARPGAGPTQTFAFNVPPGVNDLSLNLQTADPGTLLQGELLDPHGFQVSVQPSVDINGNATGLMNLSRYNPEPGQWRFVLLLNFYTSGNQTTLPFQAQVNFNSAQVSAQGLPNNPGIVLSASGAPVTVPVVITNNTVNTQAYFLDSRLRKSTVQPLGVGLLCSSPQLPGTCYGATLPTQVSGVQFIAQSRAPITMDAFAFSGFIVGGTGAPDIYAQPIGGGAVAATLIAPEVPWANWEIFPALVGPFGAAGAQSAPVNVFATVVMKQFDQAMSSDSGDLWMDVTLGTATYNPMVLAPGQTGTINLTITPDPNQVGNTITGDIYVDTFNGVTVNGDETSRLTYRYTVGR
jgi:Subtilase family/Peptidase inhibitor I9